MSKIMRVIGVLVLIGLSPRGIQAQGSASCGEEGSGFSLGEPGSGTFDEMIDAALLPAFEGEKIECRPCKAGETREIELRLVSSDIYDSPMFRGSSGLWFDANSSGELGAWLFKVHDARQIASIFELVARECVRVKQVTIDSHGEPGTLVFGGSTWNLRNLNRVIPPGAGCVMSRDAAIDLSGCNAGRGCDGARFLAGIGRRLLLKGGEVRGATHYVATIAGLTIPRPVNLQWQKYSRWPSGTETLSNPSCQEEIEEKVGHGISKLEDLERWTRGCMLSSRGRELLRKARGLAGELSAIRDLAGLEGGSGVLTRRAQEVHVSYRILMSTLDELRDDMRTHHCFVE